MAGFEPQISGVVSNHSTNWGATTDLNKSVLCYSWKTKDMEAKRDLRAHQLLPISLITDIGLLALKW